MDSVASVHSQELRLDLAEVSLGATLALPETPRGLILFAHGSGSSRFSRRNRYVAEQLHAGGLGTLLLDLLTDEEHRIDELTREYRFDIGLLAQRLVAAVDWLRPRGLPQGLFGASTGAAAALIAAAERPDLVAALVSRGGRADLAGPALASVRAPTLLIVGGEDEPVIGLNRQAESRMRCPVALEIIPGATHLFEEPGKLEQVAMLARDWFLRWIPSFSPGSPTPPGAPSRSP